jgi:hypothetical protein
LQEFANVSGLVVHVSYLPSGTSKWNKVEHKMFCFISKNWRGRPVVSVEVVVSLISSTFTAKGFRVVCVADERVYKLGQKVSDDELAVLNISRDEFLGDWNYKISPKELQVIV